MSSATIRNLTVTSSYMESAYKTFGVLFGKAAGETTVENVTLNVNLVSKLSVRTDYAGIGGMIGLVQSAKTTVQNCAIDGSILASVDVRAVGGVIGYARGDQSDISITDSVMTGNVTTGGNQCGGFVGYFSNGKSLKMDRCRFQGTVTPASWAIDTKWVGAFVGRIDGTDASAVEIKNSVYGSVHKGNQGLMNNPYGTGDTTTTGQCTTSNLTFIEAPAIIGRQIRENADSNDIRFIGYTNSLEYTSVGMRIRVRYDGQRKTADSGAIYTVYDQMVGGGETFTAQDMLLGVEGYLYGFAITGVPKDVSATFEITPYYVVNGETVDCTTVTVAYN